MHVYLHYFLSHCFVTHNFHASLPTSVIFTDVATGENWNPNISLVKSGPQDRTLFIAFDTDEHSESYKVHVICKQHKETQNLSKVRN